MRINEEFLDKDDNMQSITNVADDDLQSSPAFIMQDRRPVIKLVGDYKFLLYLPFGDYWNKNPNFVKELETTIKKRITKLKSVLERSVLDIETTPFIIGSSMNDGEWEHSRDRSLSFCQYLTEQTDDDNGFQKETNVFIGIRLKQSVPNLWDAYMKLSQVLALFFKLSHLPQIFFLWKQYDSDTFDNYERKYRSFDYR